MNFNFNNRSKNLVKFVYCNERVSPFCDGKIGSISPDPYKNQILVGLGNKYDFSKETLKKAVYKLGRYMANKDIREISFNKLNLDIDDFDFVMTIAEAIIASSYNFDHYKSEKVSYNLENVNFEEKLADCGDEIDELKIIYDAVFLARDLVNLRSNDIYPESLAQKADENLSFLGVDVKVYEKEEIREMGLTAYLEVARGSDNPPRFIVMEYMKGNPDDKPLVLVGKGITYDTGGYSLKTAAGMKDMNSDMGGAGTVIAAMKAIAANALDVNVVGIVAACENAVSGHAYKPGDIIKARNGMTIEVDNTDAEGRITLADAVNYGATEYDPAMIVDLATLTGAVLVALGQTYTGAITNNQEAMDRVLEAAKVSEEKIWQLPNDDFIRSYNDSEVADIKNSGGRLAGSITAGQFVGAFVEDKPWVHLDIAGTAYLSKAEGLSEKGASGVHVKTLYNLAKSYE